MSVMFYDENMIEHRLIVKSVHAHNDSEFSSAHCALASSILNKSRSFWKKGGRGVVPIFFL